ncbi:uncharacterized protein LOC112083440 [Eutrema salsugineum]|uniref:uncharacterized protein LOC112083440 n=1 Tax=Eutrema salsugineum TaxID=72664 RepID=UPI000CED5E8D|nr:uncharacterized protein LOC112083440 [Eutrema salsugineum]
MVLSVSTQDTKKEWILDSGCSYHSTPDKEVLFDFKEFDSGRVLMANNTHCNIKGMGKIQIQNPDGSVVILKDVKYIPEVSRNLISYGMLEKSGCRYKGGNFKVQFYKGKKKVISGKYHGGLYYLQGTVSKVEVKKEKSKKVTFSENLIQGPTPFGFEKESLSAQGGDSSSSEKSEILDEIESKKVSRDWQEIRSFNENLSMEFKENDVGKVSEILGTGIFGGRAKGDLVLSTIQTSQGIADVVTEAVPGQKAQVCCDLLNLV